MNKARLRKLMARERRQASLAGAEEFVRSREADIKKKAFLERAAKYAELKGIEIKDALKELSELKKKQKATAGQSKKDSLGSEKETREDKE